jgi:hypothetical protein
LQVEPGGEQVGKLGLVAGDGRFPLLVAEAVRQGGGEVIVVAHEGLTDPKIEEVATKTVWIKVGQLENLIRSFQEAGVGDVVMAGGFRKTLLFSGSFPDARALKLLSSIRSHEDDLILRALAEELGREGLHVRDATECVKSLLATSGPMTRREPTPGEWRDIRFGWDMAKEIGRLDIGQCVVVKERAVLAVEAIEGTDAAIRRGGALGQGGAVVVKVCKPGQDTRFDLPTVGIRTLMVMKEAGAATLAVEALKTVMIDREQMIPWADEAGIAVVGIDEGIFPIS